jgi:hypothetical protein
VRPGDGFARRCVDGRHAFLAGETLALCDHGIPNPIIACHVIA